MISPAARLAVGLGYSLETFFADSPVPRRDRIQLSGLRGEVLSFQVVHRSDRQGELGLDISGPLAASAAARRIDLAHVEHPTYRERPENRIGRAPGFYPDPLIPNVPWRTYPGQTRGIWVTLRIPRQAPAGRSRLRIRLRSGGRRAAELAVDVAVVAAMLPAQRTRSHPLVPQ